MICIGPTLADRIPAILPADPGQALSPGQLSGILIERPSEISRACRILSKWHLVAFRAGRGQSRRACNLRWRIG
jgi:hypothetical protein